MDGAPAFDTPPHVQALGQLRAWFTDPPGAVLQFARLSRGTVEVAEWAVTNGVARLRGRFPEPRGMLLVMDLSLMDGRDPAARGVMLEHAREVRGMFSRIRIVPPLRTNTVYLGTLHAAVLVLNALGIEASASWIKLHEQARALVRFLLVTGLRPRFDLSRERIGRERALR
jgi:hypothetical protein